ncbi:transcription antitermination factor NusB [Larkinella soli]|uniref:transcription antitermination factor NusB n=1 Tax=Larkinella soli TaxID=1770527 RepID=UPI001E46EE4D|nr:transcription antitermination factor NusB [Larkinella soli]
MLNRRLLRIKVMQALYALRQAELSAQQLAVDAIAETFQPDLNSMEPQNLQQLEGYRRLATVLFEEGLKEGQPKDEEDTPRKVWKAANDALAFYRNALTKDRQRALQMMLEAVRTLDDSYIRLLTLLIELAHVARIDRERPYENLSSRAIARESGLDQNRIVRALEEYEPLRREALRRKINWEEEVPLVRKIYNDVLKQDDTYRTYCETARHSADEDQELVQYVLRTLLLKHDPAKTWFEENDIAWSENAELVRGMTIKTLKAVQSMEGLKLMDLSDDWEEDQNFLETLYKKSLENDEEYEKLLADQLKNWDVERVALLDRIILKLAVCELLNFPNIPVKVTINEYIELAKLYSTPKSGKFVNGILDSLSEKLKASGQMRKSGRGLLDNK